MRLQSNVKKLFVGGALFIFLLGGAQDAHAQTITENTPLNFGTFALVDNSAPRILELLPGGGYNADPEYMLLTTPQMGNITVDGYAPGETLTVTVGITNLNPMGGGSANFATSATFTNPPVVITNGTGSVTFDVGATLSSDGGGFTLNDDDYEGTYTVMVTN